MTSPAVTTRFNAFVQNDEYNALGTGSLSRQNKTENDPPSQDSANGTFLRPSLEKPSTMASRRKPGLRDSQGPFGPRPLASSTRSSNELAGRPSLPSTVSEPFLGLSGRRRNGSGSLAAAASSTEALPESSDVSAAGGHKIKATLRPQSYARTSLASEPLKSKRTVSSDSTTSIDRKSNVPARTPRASPTRPPRQPSASRQGSVALDVVGTVPNVGSHKLRRQSQFPPPSSGPPLAKQPRKSIGPGFISSTSKDRTFSGADFSFLQPNEARKPEPPRNSIGPSFMASTDASRAAAAAKAPRTQQPPPPTGDTRRNSTLDSQDIWNEEIESRTGLKGSRPKSQVPVQPPASKRQSTYPVAASAIARTVSPTDVRRNRQSSISATSSTGLGARTVSPTDARKLKRISTAHHVPPMPTRTGPTPEIPSHFKGGSDSLQAPRQRTNTPSSARATPDALTRPGSSGRPVSSRSSYHSFRPPSSSQQQRPAPQPSPWRASMVKVRDGTSETPEPAEEYVPPVPAIPKAYESPQDQEVPFFSDLTNALSAARSNEQPAASPSRVVENGSKNTLENRQKRGNTLGTRVDTKPASNQAKLRSQQPRLPPINLLPLSTPTAAKIASISQRRQNTPVGQTTPPPSKNQPKIPATPLTASKASFTLHELHHQNSLPDIRSNTSHGNGQAGSITRNESRSTSSGPNDTSETIGTPRSALSPFISASLPKSDDGFKSPLKDKADRAQSSAASKLVRKRSRSASKTTKDAGTSDLDSPTTGTSLRHRLSISWKRSGSKNSQRRDADSQPVSSDIVPPKIPASVLYNDSLRLSPTMMLNPSVTDASDQTKATSVTSSVSSLTPKPLTVDTSLADNTKVEQALPSNHSGSSLLSPMQKILHPRTSHRQAAAMRSESKTDVDSGADEEMRKLASKKKDFESAAKDLEDLNKRASPKEAVSPGQAARSANLNIFERGEIVDYKDVYFCGSKNAKKMVGDLSTQNGNFGFDDERGDYNIVLGDHLAFRYEVVDMLGKGSFGQVVRCIDHKTGKLVAVKIIRNKKRFHQQALVEVGLLQKLRDWDPGNKFSMVNFTQSFYFRGHLCISTELLGMNLYEFIKAHDFRGFSLKLIRRFTKQMLNSLYLLQQKKVIHCDLKPENVLLAHPIRSEIKVIDFGSSCFENEKVYTYIQSRFYRSPEVILGVTYGMPIDMWSLGCILAELYTGYPLFPGENEQEQLACIMEVFGPPEKHIIEQSTRKKLFFDSLGKPRVTVSSKGKRRRPSSKTLQQALRCEDDAFIDFITKCLRWDPERRMKPDEALRHEFTNGTKKLISSKPQPGPMKTAHSPAKQLQTSRTPSSKPRVQLDPLATKQKLTVSGGKREEPGAHSPVKIGARRQSTMTGMPNGGSTKPITSTSASALPRVTQRSASGKPDLASAAAIASLRPK